MYIHVKVKAGAKKESFEKLKDDHFAAAVRQKAERNRANVRVVELVAEHFGVSAKSVRIVSGHHSPSKLLAVPDAETP
jgi:uncharacterized protein YggU (UPF0235/DUF167 family)